MGVNLAAQIPDGATVLIDTNPIIYMFEGSALAAPFEAIFADIDAGRIQALVTPVTVAEVVTGPLKAGKEALAERYRQALCAGRGWSLREIDADIAVLSARLRLRHRLRLPDAIQIAVAVHEGCHALVTHDRDFQGITDLLVLGAKAPDPPPAA
jgi:predicted nucleic acid-binding protein